MKRLLPLLLALTLLSACAIPARSQLYQATWLDVFDTVTTVTGRAESRTAFDAQAQALYEELLLCHRLFDIYHDYPDLHNLKTVNDNAGVAPVTVDERIIRLLLDCREIHTLTGGRVNAAMGSVLSLWHENRSAGIADPANARLPDSTALQEASLHTNFSAVIIDENASTVYLSDPLMRLDVGAIAKGWAAEQLRQSLPEGWLLNLGGNVCATGPKPDGTPWVVGLQDPDGNADYLLAVTVSTGAVVTSGDYQRYYTVDGVRFHHIIDPDTLAPAAFWRAVTVLCDDSALADGLSTALFTLPLAEGQALLEQCSAEALWIAPDGTQSFSPGFAARIQP